MKTLLAFFLSSLFYWSFKVPHLSFASLPLKNKMCVTLSSSGVWVMVKYYISLSTVHQVNEVKVTKPQPGTMWDLKAAAELPTVQEDQSE